MRNGGKSSVSKDELVEKYFEDIEARYKSGNNATEHTHRPALQNLIESLFPEIMATNEPQRIDCGAPDYVLTKGQIPIGYIEAKDLDKSLSEQEGTEQIQRYLRSLDNLILTNYLEFRWYVKGKLRSEYSIGSLAKKKLSRDESPSAGLVAFLGAFVSAQIPTIRSAQELAERLAGTTSNIYHLLLKSYEVEPEEGYLHSWLEAFRKVLIKDLKLPRFADMFAQTLVYGYFSARVNQPDSDAFSRDSASRILPETNPFLRRLFHEFIGLDMPSSVGWAVDEVVELLRRTDIQKVMKDFNSKTGKDDPIFHFYETFLEKYNPELKDALGAYYTPRPVIEYIVRSVDSVIQTHFGRMRGLADPKTLILDPATGTGSFLHRVIDVIREKLQGQEGAWPQYVSEHLLDRIFGFEIMMAPYAVAHLKIGNQLKTGGYEFTGGKRLGVYLTNTLEEAALRTDDLFASFISDEANQAASIKADKPIVAVLGNPPYKGFAQNSGTWIQSLMKDYKEGLGEKKNNSDNDYMKFLRFAQWRIDKTGYGVAAFITPSSYLDAITLRQMRTSLLNSFSEIYVLNLHGSAMVENEKAKEQKDKNVFDIRQGVAISILVRKVEATGGCRVFYHEIFGSREKKYKFLASHDVTNTQWEELPVSKERNFFSPMSLEKVDGYEAFVPIRDIFPISSSGIQPKKKEIAVQFTESEMNQVISDLALLTDVEFKKKYRIAKESKGWKVEWARKHAKKFLREGKCPARIQYRTFDYRWTVIDDVSSGIVGRPRFETMKHLNRPNNIGMVLLRQLSQASFQHAWVSRCPIDENTISRKTREYNYIFPLFLEPDSDQLITDGQRLNIAPGVYGMLKRGLGLTLTSGIHGDFKRTIGPEQFFYYIYAILHSPSYRSEFFSELKIDFPRVPIFQSKSLVKRLSELGRELARHHLLEHDSQTDPSVTFPQQGTNLVQSLKFDTKNNRLWINDEQYFEKVTESEWSQKVGGHEVLREYFTDRHGRSLTFDEIEVIRRMVVALKETPALMIEVDKAIEESGGWGQIPVLSLNQKSADVEESKVRQGSVATSA